MCIIALFFNELSNFIIASGEETDSALKALRGAHKKAILFKGHRLRVLNQKNSIEKALATMRQNRLQNEARPYLLSRKTVDHYGKRGMSRHGAMFQYYTMDGNNSPKLEKSYMDHVIGNENK
jgi:hypothetical protein